MGESGSEVSYFIPEPRNFAEVTKLLDDIKKPWLKATIKYIKNLINNHNFRVEDTSKQKAVVHQLDFIVAFLQEKVKNRVFLKLDSIYAD